MNVHLIVNPIAGNRAFRYIDRIEKLLGQRASLTTSITERQGDAFRFASSATPCDRIIVASGDGTINEVVNGLLSRSDGRAGNTSVALIPLGITNVLAKELGVPENVDRAVNLALTGKAKKISLGRINDRYFLTMAGAGFDGETVLGVTRGTMKKISGKAAHVFAGARVLLRYAPSVIEMKSGDIDTYGSSVVVGNARYYGGFFSVTPRACLTDPHLDVCLFRGRGRWDLVRFITGVIMKRHLTFDDIQYFKVKNLELTSRETVHIQIDGDYFGTLPAHMNVVPDAISVVPGNESL